MKVVTHETDTVEISGMWPALTARSKIFDAECTVRGYTPSVLANRAGWLNFEVLRYGKDKREVLKPFHFLFNKVLYAMKKNKMKTSDSFGLNHELFAEDLEWDCSVVLHFIEDEPRLFIISKEEWKKFGTLPSQQSEELQVFIEMPDERSLPIAMIPKGGLGWLQECCRFYNSRKSKWSQS